MLPAIPFRHVNVAPWCGAALIYAENGHCRQGLRIRFSGDADR
jgi:hypothetical protein